MKTMLIITIGISGSGKNHLLSLLEKRFSIGVVEPDDIRRKKLGDVNNQENGGMIFSIAKSMINKLLTKEEIVYFNATNVDWRRTVQFVLDLDKAPNKEVLFIFMMDSKNLELCKQRVNNDISNNVDRSNVPEEIIDNQYKRFLKCHQEALNNHEIGIKNCPENWKIFQYKDNSNELIYFIEEMLNGNS